MSRAVTETRLKGVPLSPGIALGRACLYLRHTPVPGRGPQADPLREAFRLRQSLLSLGSQLDALARDAEARVGRENAQIFHAHRLMLTDETFQHRLFHAVEEKGCTAEKAVERELNFYRAQLEAADSEYLQQRAHDIREIQQALLDRLNHAAPCRRCRDVDFCSVGHCRLANDHVLVGEELSASLPIETDRYTVGYIVEKGGPTSHAVILARALQRPAVGNILQVSTVIPLAAKVLINGDTGEVIINPSAATLARYRPALAGAGQGTSVSDPVPGLKVMANIERSTDVHEVLAARAEGIGLYRTEMELLVEGRLLSETEQAARYADVVRAMAGKPVYIRLLDFGADKAATCLDLSPQGDFRPGLRGAELLLACPELLHTQARALARASRHGPIHVLYPMIVGVNQFRELRARFDEAVADLQSSGLRHGVLFEVPSACLQAQRILGLADFGCIGTNDLIQYLFAADRTNGVLSSDTCLETESVLWRIIQGLSRAATAAGKPMAICGELAGNPDLTRRVIQAGISAVSTSPSRIADVRRAARRATTH
jgi:phosphotransferase system enzyme I (PtsI)